MCSLNLSANVLPDSLMYSSSQSTLPHLKNNQTCVLAPITALTSATTTAETTSIPTSTKEQLDKWVKNLLGVPLTKAQVSLLAHGPNFAIGPRQPLYWEYIATVEEACLNLEPHNAEELRAEIKNILKHSHNSRKNINKEEAQALAELRKDHSVVTLEQPCSTADHQPTVVLFEDHLFPVPGWVL